MDHSDIWNAVERFAAAHGMSCSKMARCSGLDPTTFNKSKRFSKFGQPRWPSLGTISKILKSTNETFSEFAKYIPDKRNTSRD